MIKKNYDRETKYIILKEKHMYVETNVHLVTSHLPYPKLRNAKTRKKK